MIRLYYLVVNNCCLYDFMTKIIVEALTHYFSCVRILGNTSRATTEFLRKLSIYLKSKTKTKTKLITQKNLLMILRRFNEKKERGHFTILL